MSSHFWLSSRAITLTSAEVSAMDDAEARYFLAEMRWKVRNQQVCPDCGVQDSHYDLRSRNKWRCKHCFKEFSVTSGTPFHRCRIGYRRLAIALMAFTIRQKGFEALELRREIGGHYATCFTLLHKIRTALWVTRKKEKLSGIVEIDGAHVSGRKRKPRKKKVSKKEDKTAVPQKYSQHRQRVPRSAHPYHPNRRIWMTLRQIIPGVTNRIDKRTGKPIGNGAGRTIVEICRSENQADIEALVRQYVEQGTLIRTDELPGYGNLKLMGYEHQTVNHSEEFCSDEGINQNQAESFFARMRRGCIGVHHRITPEYMADYGEEYAWREEVRRVDTRNQMKSLVSRILATGPLPDWTNYSHGNHRKKELLYEAHRPA
jgi:transposase-like protein